MIAGMIERVTGGAPDTCEAALEDANASLDQAELFLEGEAEKPEFDETRLEGCDAAGIDMLEDRLVEIYEKVTYQSRIF